MIEILSFTRVDIHTNPEDLLSIAQEFPQAEFAVLIGTPTDNIHPLFPPIEVIHRLRELGPKVNTAIHLCGQYARAVITTGPQARESLNVSNGFGRIQVNLHGDHIDSNNITIFPEAFRQFVDTVQADKVILQHRAGWNSAPLDHPKVEYLFDLSEGSGLESFDAWPPPPPFKRVGYAGGISPHNIHQAMKFVDLHPRAHIWLDMENQIRDQNHPGRLQSCSIRAVRPGDNRTPRLKLRVPALAG